MKLTAENVHKIFCDCLFKEEELTNGKPNCEYIVAEGILNDFAFNIKRLNQHEQEIIELIDQLPDIEKGQSFLNLCMTTEGVQWGEHINIEQLMALGIASENLAYCFPKQLWQVLPGGMPYVIKKTKENNRAL